MLLNSCSLDFDISYLLVVLTATLTCFGSSARLVVAGSIFVLTFDLETGFEGWRIIVGAFFAVVPLGSGIPSALSTAVLVMVVLTGPN